MSDLQNAIADFITAYGEYSIVDAIIPAQTYGCVKIIFKTSDFKSYVWHENSRTFTIIE